MHLGDGRQGCDGLVRDHRRAAVHRARRGLDLAVQKDAASVGVLLRRRHDEHRRVSRSAEPRSGLEAARWCSSARTTCTWSTRAIGEVTPVKRPAADRAAAYGLEPHRRRRQRCRCMLSASRETAYERARARRRSLADRSADLSPRRPFARRSRQRTARRLRSRRGCSAIRCRCTAHDCWPSGVADAQTSSAIEAAAMAEIDAATEAAKNGPLPADEIEQRIRGPTGRRHGGIDLPRRGRGRDRAGDGTRRERRVPRRGCRRRRRRVQGDRRFAGTLRTRRACATRRSPKWRSSARRWAPR